MLLFCIPSFLKQFLNLHQNSTLCCFPSLFTLAGRTGPSPRSGQFGLNCGDFWEKGWCPHLMIQGLLSRPETSRGAEKWLWVSPAAQCPFSRALNPQWGYPDSCPHLLIFSRRTEHTRQNSDYKQKSESCSICQEQTKPSGPLCSTNSFRSPNPSPIPSLFHEVFRCQLCWLKWSHWVFIPPCFLCSLWFSFAPTEILLIGIPPKIFLFAGLVKPLI